MNCHIIRAALSFSRPKLASHVPAVEENHLRRTVKLRGLTVCRGCTERKFLVVGVAAFSTNDTCDMRSGTCRRTHAISRRVITMLEARWTIGPAADGPLQLPDQPHISDVDADD